MIYLKNSQVLIPDYANIFEYIKRFSEGKQYSILFEYSRKISNGELKKARKEMQNILQKKILEFTKGKKLFFLKELYKHLREEGIFITMQTKQSIQKYLTKLAKEGKIKRITKRKIEVIE